MRVILHNIRSVYNVGSIFRSADGAGIERIYLTGFSPTPLDQFGQIRSDFHKTALGAEESVNWQQEKNIVDLIQELKSQGFTIVAVEQAPDSIVYTKAQLDLEKTILIFGHEVKGVDQSILALADQIIEIPMKGKKNSLNVSVAFGIVSYHYSSQ
ncbi:MAG: RNA methyltransferase [Candidatus Harrisonbacteria bacterium]|nr:RNA methyltransferase [Candidatus Harrisonbacteria bacterium]